MDEGQCLVLGLRACGDQLEGAGAGILEPSGSHCLLARFQPRVGGVQEFFAIEFAQGGQDGV